MRFKQDMVTAVLMGVVFFGFGAVKLVAPLDSGSFSVALFDVDAGSSLGKSLQFGAGVLEIAIGAALVSRSARSRAAIAAAIFGVVCAAAAAIELLAGLNQACGCLGNVRFPLSARMLVCAGFILGGSSLIRGSRGATGSLPASS